MSYDLIIYRCGGHARSILNIALEFYSREKILLIDEGAKDGELILGCKVVKSCSNVNGKHYIVALGNNEARHKLFQNIMDKGGIPCSIISRDADIGKFSTVGCGSFIAKKVFIGADAKIGSDSIINTGVIIEHESVIGNHCHIAPGALICGRCNVGNNVMIGAGAVVKDKISICDNAIVGAGAVVVKNIESIGVYIGIPARLKGERC